MWRSFGFCLATLFLTLPLAASAQVTRGEDVIAPPEDEIMVSGAPFPLCYKRPGDPLDAISARGSMRQQMVVPVGPLRNTLLTDSDPVLGPGIWQRAGFQMSAYIFRVPLDGTPMCIGSRGAPVRSWGQLRTVIEVRPLLGKYVRFTGFIATRPGDNARVWLTTATSTTIMQGDTGGSRPVNGTGRWEPFAVTMGPIRGGASKLSYGFLLGGRGDMWITRVSLEVFDKRPPTVGKVTV
jgi:hypothetical protein